MIKAIEFVAGFLYLWFLTTMVTGQIWLWSAWSAAFVGLCAYEVGKYVRRNRKRQQAKQQLAIAESNARRAAERAIAKAQRGYGSVLADEATRMLCCPN
jgi:hypothetical protein